MLAAELKGPFRWNLENRNAERNVDHGGPAQDISGGTKDSIRRWANNHLCGISANNLPSFCCALRT